MKQRAQNKACDWIEQHVPKHANGQLAQSTWSPMTTTHSPEQLTGLSHYLCMGTNFV